MVLDLAQFMILWITTLLIFASLSGLLFGDLEVYGSFGSNLLNHFESALGNWDSKVTCSNDGAADKLLERPQEEQDAAALLCTIGKVYTVVVLLVHSVLFLNFVIAILSSTFASYEDKSTGLYYEVLVALFPKMDYDEDYGYIVCAQLPFSILILPFQWIPFLPLTETWNR